MVSVLSQSVSNSRSQLVSIICIYNRHHWASSITPPNCDAGSPCTTLSKHCFRVGSEKWKCRKVFIWPEWKQNLLLLSLLLQLDSKSKVRVYQSVERKLVSNLKRTGKLIFFFKTLCMYKVPPISHSPQFIILEWGHSLTGLFSMLSNQHLFLVHPLRGTGGFPAVGQCFQIWTWRGVCVCFNLLNCQFKEALPLPQVVS